MDFVQQASDHFVELVPSPLLRLCLSSIAAMTIVWLFFRIMFGRSSKRISPEGKVVLVTGCDTPLGFGTAVARKLYEMGYVVFAGCLNAEQSRDSVYADLKDSKRFQVIQLDVTDQSQVDNSAEVVKKWLKENPGYYFHSAVNNAGICLFGPVEWFEMEPIYRIFDVNCFGVIRVTKAFLPLLRKGSKDGRVVNIASMASDISVPYCAAYSGSKAALLMISDCLRVEMADLKTKVCAVCPDFYRTNLISYDTLLDTMRQQFVEVDEEIRKPYGSDRVLRLLTELLTNGLAIFGKFDVTPVVDCVVDAVISVEPKRKYQCYEFSTIFSKFLYNYFPPWYDRMHRLTIKIVGIVRQVDKSVE